VDEPTRIKAVKIDGIVMITVYEHGSAEPVAEKEVTPEHAIRIAFNIMEEALK
jgi:hypothetical protein